MRGDQVVVHVARMAGGVAQPRDARDSREPMQQRGRASQARPSASFAVIGVDVLAEQRDLAHAGVGQPLDLGDDLRDRPRDFGAARIGHDAEGAELVAAFLHGDEGRRRRACAIAARLGAAQRVELVLDRKFGVDDLLAALGAREQLGSR